MARPTYLICRNETQNTLLGDKIRKADTYLSRLVGLLNRKHLTPGEGLWIIPCADIHSIGMQFVFDALFLDKDLTVVHMVERMKPFRATWPVRTAHTVLELDGGVIAATHTRLGDRLSFEPSL